MGLFDRLAKCHQVSSFFPCNVEAKNPRRRILQEPTHNLKILQIALMKLEIEDTILGQYFTKPLMCCNSSQHTNEQFNHNILMNNV